MRILLIEDDELLGDGIKKSLLQVPGFVVDWLKEGTSASNVLQLEKFDVVLLDLSLPGKAGLEILRIMRQNGNDTPVIILTARVTVDERIQGLDTGADDYLIKPVDNHELIARIRAIKRRSANPIVTVLTHENVTLNSAAYEVTVNGKSINLPRREFSLLQKLMENVGQALSREQLTQTLYGWEEDIDSNTLEVHIHNLRKKFPALSVRTLRGIGYLLEKSKEEGE